MANRKKNLENLARLAVPEQRSPAEQAAIAFRTLEYHIDPILFCREALKFAPDPWQERLISSQGRRIIVNCARQSGKSTTAAAKAAHRAVLVPGSLVIIVAPVVPQADELLRKVQEHLRCMADLQVRPIKDNKRGIELDNRSRILVLAADQDTVRSYTADMIIEDESATVPDAVYETLEPMLLVTKGQYIILGTPKGIKGHFADIWHGNLEHWERFQISAWDNPRVPRAALEQIRREKEALGRLWWFQQEYECSFVAAAQGLVYPYDIRRNVSPKLDLHRRHGWQYVLGIDYGFNDSTAFVVLGWQRDDPCVYVIESMDKRGLTPTQAAEIAHQYAAKYPFARMVGDTGGLGKGYVEEARRRFKLPLEAAEKNNKRGYIEIMAGDMKTGHIKVFPGNEGLVDEWQKLPWDEEREEPAEGHKDHLSDAALYAYRATLHYLEEVRKLRPAKGTPEALQAEAEAMFEERIRDVTKGDREWWDVSDPTWLDPRGTAFPN